MATEEGAESGSLLDEVMEDIRNELVRRVAANNRDVYDALEARLQHLQFGVTVDETRSNILSSRACNVVPPVI